MAASWGDDRGAVRLRGARGCGSKVATVSWSSPKYLAATACTCSGVTLRSKASRRAWAPGPNPCAQLRPSSCAWLIIESRWYTLAGIHCVLTRSSSAWPTPSRATRATSARSASSTCCAARPAAGTPLSRNRLGPRPMTSAELLALSGTGCAPWWGQAVEQERARAASDDQCRTAGAVGHGLRALGQRPFEPGAVVAAEHGGQHLQRQ